MHAFRRYKVVITNILKINIDRLRETGVTIFLPSSSYSICYQTLYFRLEIFETFILRVCIFFGKFNFHFPRVTRKYHRFLICPVKFQKFTFPD